MGTHYELDRDKAVRALAKAMAPKTKVCERCGTEKPNDFEHFGKRLCGTRHTFATLGVCKACSSAKRSATAAAKLREEREYQENRAAALERLHGAKRT